MDIWRTIAERKIQEAIEAGEFRNLDGRGAPLALDDDPFADPSLRMAHRLLKNNGFAPAWIEEGREIDADLDRARQDMRRAGADAAAVERFGRATAEIAQHIARFAICPKSSAARARCRCMPALLRPPTPAAPEPRRP